MDGCKTWALADNGRNTSYIQTQGAEGNKSSIKETMTSLLDIIMK